MARNRFAVLRQPAVLYAVLSLASCGFQKIDLSVPPVQCNMSSVYPGSLPCTGAINGNTSTTWAPGANCILTAGGTEGTHWLVDIGQWHNIHRITVYPDTSSDYLRGAVVQVNGKDVFTFPNDSKIVDTVYVTSDNSSLPVFAGRFITFAKRTAGPLAFCELQVEGCSKTTSDDLCNKTCSTNCRDSDCNSINEFCTKGCVAGWHDNTCTLQCGENCANNSCQQGTGRCNMGCKPGWYGEGCHVKCSNTCKPDQNGHRVCGFHSFLGTCTEGCVDGWFGLSCETPCPANCAGGCKKDNGTCFGCSEHMFGVLCDKMCNVNCWNRSCDAMSGLCAKGCVDGWWGYTCTYQCPENCEQGACQQSTGKCPGCKRGWYTEACNAKCSDTCRSDLNGHKICNFLLGTCTEGCVDGWFGPDCKTPCSANCAGGCDRDNGTCSDCVEGWYGPNCTFQCPVNCDGQCQRENGICYYCAEGCYGQKCTLECPDNCEGPCQKEDGTCNRCKIGFYGLQCQTACGKGCVDGNCDRLSGACDSQAGWVSPLCNECGSGYYGVDTCTECGHCRDGDVCRTDNGRCPNGCQQLFVGERCDKCTVGRWSDNCSHACGNCSGDGSCDMDTGRCLFGCQEGFRGSTCTQTAAASDGENEGQTESNITGPLVGGLLGAGALIALSVLLSAVIRRYRNTSRRAKESMPETQQDHNPEAPTNTKEGFQTSHSALTATSIYDIPDRYENPADMKMYTALSRTTDAAYLNVMQAPHFAGMRNGGTIGSY